MNQDMGVGEIRACIVAYCAEPRDELDLVAHTMALSRKLDRRMAKDLIRGCAGKGWLDFGGSREITMTAGGSAMLSKREGGGQ